MAQRYVLSKCFSKNWLYI